MMFTVYENDEKIFEALQARASGYQLKKSSAAEIKNAVKELHAGGSPMSPSIDRKLINIFREQNNPFPDSSHLTRRENEILQLLSQGLLYKEIATRLFIGIGTVRQYIHSIYEKLHVQNRTEAMNKFQKDRPA